MPRSRSRTLCALAVFAALLATRPAPAHELGPGDVLISDSANDRLLHYDPDTGEVDVFAPRDPFELNFLQQPGGVIVDTNGAVYAVSREAAWLVRLDPQTGAQSLVADDESNLVGIGASPFGLGIAPVTSNLLYRRDLFVASAGEIWRVRRPVGFLGSPTSSLFESDTDLEGASTALAVLEEGGELAEIYTTGVVGFVRYRFADGSTHLVLDGSGFAGVDAGFGLLVYTRQDPCNAADNDSGVYAFDTSGVGMSIPLVVAGDLSCPGPVALASATEMYVARRSVFPPSIIRIADEGTEWAPGPPIPLPDGSEVVDLAVVPATYTPEPAAAPPAALLALALVARARRRRTNVRRAGFRAASPASRGVATAGAEAARGTGCRDAATSRA